MDSTMTPYKGLVPFSEQDAQLFFGREKDTKIIAANLMTSRLTLLYGMSGVGKSSVLRAGVAPYLRRLAREAQDGTDLPEFTVVIFSQWRGSIVDGLQKAIREAIAESTCIQITVELPSSISLYQTLKTYGELTRSELFIILDQFEEYFLYHRGDEEGEAFATEFASAVNDAALPVNFIISIREDALAKLDFFKGRIANLFGNYLRIDHLNYEAAHAAIVTPIQAYNTLSQSSPPVTIEAALVETVLEQIRSAEGKYGFLDDDKKDEWRIETPYLQLIMTRLWRQEFDAGSHVLRLRTLERIGGASHLVRTHVDDSIRILSASEQDIAAQIFKFLVTPTGTKMALTVTDLTSYVGVTQERLLPVLNKLASPEVRILRPVEPLPNSPNMPSYEIMHDLLAVAVSDWRQRYEQDKRSSRFTRLIEKLT